MPSVRPTCPPSKRRLASIARGTGIVAAVSALQGRGGAVRVVNLHGVPERLAGAFAAQLQRLRRVWHFATPAELPSLLTQGATRPTLLFSFDDGLANTVEIAAPLLEAVGGRAIFAVPAAWPDVPREQAAAWFRTHVYPTATELHCATGDVVPASWAALTDAVARGHAVWSHGADHVQLTPNLPAEVLRREVVDSRRMLEERLGVPVEGYCPPVSWSVPPGAAALVRSHYAFAFGGAPGIVRPGSDPWQIPRSNIEASWPDAAVATQLSPVGDTVTRVLAKVRS